MMKKLILSMACLAAWTVYAADMTPVWQNPNVNQQNREPRRADFFAFDDSFAAPGTEFSQANPELEGTYLNPVPVDLTRHNITCTLGFKF